MPKVEMTDRFCQTAKPGQRRQADFFDLTVRGLCLRVSSGGAKSFFQIYTRPTDGKRAWLKLGTYPELTLAAARQKARDARSAVGEGSDPIAERKALAASQSVSDLIENYLTRHASTKKSAGEISRRLRKNVGEVIGATRLADLHRRDLTRCIDAVKDRGAHTEANRLFEDMRAMVRWARARGDLDENLTEGMRRPTETVERDRVLSSAEIRIMWHALGKAEMRESTRRVLRLCLVTGQRVGEVTGLVRSELNLEAGTWTIPAARAKNGRQHMVPLSGMAIAIIREQIAEAGALAERKCRPVPQFVFPAPGGRAAVTAASVPKAVKREQVAKRGVVSILGVAPWTPHDLRRTAATGMEELGVSPFIVGHVLNHASATRATVTSRVYARYDYAAEKRRALDLWAERLAGIVDRSASVVAIGRASAQWQ
jgi:integrase